MKINKCKKCPYLYNDEYGTVVNYYDQEIFSKKILFRETMMWYIYTSGLHKYSFIYVFRGVKNK